MDPICSFVCCFSRTLYSLSVPGKQEQGELHTILRTEIMRKGTYLDSFQWLPSVTFYLQVIYSVMPLLLRIWNAFWPFEDCYLLGFVFAQFFLLSKAAFRKGRGTRDQIANIPWNIENALDLQGKNLLLLYWLLQNLWPCGSQQTVENP